MGLARLSMSLSRRRRQIGCYGAPTDIAGDSVGKTVRAYPPSEVTDSAHSWRNSRAGVTVVEGSCVRAVGALGFAGRTQREISPDLCGVLRRYLPIVIVIPKSLG
jgi:hypothetical protein